MKRCRRVKRPRTAVLLFVVVTVLHAAGCGHPPVPARNREPIKVDFVLRDDQTHDKFSRRIEPVLHAPSGSIIEAFAHEATGGQFTIRSTDPTDVDTPKMLAAMHMPRAIFAGRL